MTSQKFEALGIWEIGRQHVFDAIYLGTKEVLKVGGTSDYVANGTACALHGDHVGGREVSENLDEDLCRKSEEGVCGSDLILWCWFVFALVLV
jgi:hypothetical protein